MSWHESDSDIEAKFAELRARETIFETQIGQIRKYQRNINNLKMIPSSETIFSLPANFAGNEIDSAYRDSQKADLIVNIDKFLETKIKAFYKYKSQVRKGQRDNHTIRAQAEYRGSEVGMKFSEAFCMHRSLV